MKNKLLDNLVWIVFTIFGVLFLTISFFIYNFGFIEEEDRLGVVATVIEITGDEEDPEVIVSYVVNNVVYEGNLNSYSISHYEGEEIMIICDKNNPNKIMDDSAIMSSYIFGGMGIFFVIVAVIVIIVKKRKEKRIIWLKENGNIVNAKYLSTKINKNYVVNDRHPYNILCEWNNSMDGKKYVFKSENIWFDPEPIIKERNIKTFRVYFNLNNLKQYYVDVEMLLDKEGYLR